MQSAAKGLSTIDCFIGKGVTYDRQVDVHAYPISGSELNGVQSCTSCNEGESKTQRQFQTTFEIIETKGEITHNEQFLLLPQCFPTYSVNILEIQ